MAVSNCRRPYTCSHALDRISGSSSDQLARGSGANVQAMLARKTSSSTNAIGLLRTSEKQNPEVANKIWLQPPLLGTNGISNSGASRWSPRPPVESTISSPQNVDETGPRTE